MKKAEITKKVEDTAKILDLTEVLDRKPAQLSGGQRQRVAMGRAIVRHPKAFLMDEPLSNLDAKLRVQMRGEIARLQRRLGTTTVYVTHDQTEAMTLGDRVVVMRGGVVQQIGAPDELYERPANLFVAGFIGSPAMNFFPASVTATGLSLAFGEVTLTQPVLDVLAAQPGAEGRDRRRSAGTSAGRRADRRLPADQRVELRGEGRPGRVVGCRQVRLLHRRGSARALRPAIRTRRRNRSGGARIRCPGAGRVEGRQRQEARVGFRHSATRGFRSRQRCRI